MQEPFQPANNGALRPVFPPYAPALMRLAEQCEHEIEFYSSLLAGRQTGQILVDRPERPSAALFWHDCGYAFVAGAPVQAFLDEVKAVALGTHPLLADARAHKRRFILQQEDVRLERLFCNEPGLIKKERVCFRLDGARVQQSALPGGFLLCDMDASALLCMQGDVTPAFSWPSDAAFLRYGKGFCIKHDGEIVAWAFSSAVGGGRVDIGVETRPQYRGLGLGRAAAAAMAEDTLHRGMLPVWGCDGKNIASQKTALSVGFTLTGRHAKYVRAPGTPMTPRKT